MLRLQSQRKGNTACLDSAVFPAESWRSSVTTIFRNVPSLNDSSRRVPFSRCLSDWQIHSFGETFEHDEVVTRVGIDDVEMPTCCPEVGMPKRRTWGGRSISVCFLVHSTFRATIHSWTEAAKDTKHVGRWPGPGGRIQTVQLFLSL